MQLLLDESIRDLISDLLLELILGLILLDVSLLVLDVGIHLLVLDVGIHLLVLGDLRDGTFILGFLKCILILLRAGSCNREAAHEMLRDVRVVLILSKVVADGRVQLFKSLPLSSLPTVGLVRQSPRSRRSLGQQACLRSGWI